MPPKELLQVIAQVYAGRKPIPSRIAAHFAEHLSDEALTKREIEVFIELAGANRSPEIAEKLFIAEKNGKGSYQTHYEKAGGQRSDASSCHWSPAEHYPTVPAGTE